VTACRCGCGRPAPDLADACQRRWRYHGRPEILPPPVQRGNDRRRQERIEDYLELRSWGVSREEAARRLCVSFRTIERYDRALRDESRAACTAEGQVA
jgi:hypothetical protein